MPTTEVPVEIISRDSRQSGAANISLGARSGMIYFVTVRMPDGEERKIKVPAKLHQRAIGATNLNDVLVSLTRPGKRPISVSIGRKSTIQSDATLDKVVNFNKDEKQIKSSTEARQHYSLLMPLTVVSRS